jgi:hypothetical protein
MKRIQREGGENNWGTRYHPLDVAITYRVYVEGKWVEDSGKTFYLEKGNDIILKVIR